MSSIDKDQVEERLTTGILGQWYAVAKSVQVKRDKPQAVMALGRHLVLWRDTAGKLHCLEDYCPHRGARLSRGEVNADNISCRYHGVTLDGSGTVIVNADTFDDNDVVCLAPEVDAFAQQLSIDATSFRASSEMRG